MSAQLSAPVQTSFRSNVVPIKLCVTQRHRAYLFRWLEAGERMGLHDAEIAYCTPDGDCPDGIVLIWVRESPRGQTLAEYALIFAALSLAAFAAYQSIGNGIVILGNGLSNNLTSA